MTITRTAIGTAQNKTAGTSLTVSGGAATVAVGDLLFVSVSADNTATGGGNTATINSVSDSAGNSYTKLVEANSSSGVAADGVCVALFRCSVTNALDFGAGATITVSMNSRTAKSMAVDKFTSDLGDLTYAVTSSASGSWAGGFSGNFARKTGLFVANGWEGPNGDTYTKNSALTAASAIGTTGGTATDNVSLRTEWLDDSWGSFTNGATGGSGDKCAVYATFTEPNPTPAVTDVFAFCSGNSKSSSSSLSVSTFSADASVGKLAMIVVAFDNITTTDGETTNVTGITDARSNTWTRLIEYTNGQGGAGSGASVSIWVSKITTAIQSADNITISFSSAITAKAMLGQVFTISGSYNWAIGSAKATNATDGADPASFSITGMTGGLEQLVLFGCAHEGPTSEAPTQDPFWGTGFSGHDGTTGGSAVTNMCAYGGYCITADTSRTLNLGWAARDHAQAIGVIEITTAELIISPGGIASAFASGSHTLQYAQTVIGTGLSSAEAFGSHSVSQPLIVTTSGISTAEAVGSHRLDLTLIASGIASAYASGSHSVVPGPVLILPSGLSSAEAFGSHSVIGIQLITPSGLATLEAFGTLAVHRFLVMAGMSSAEVFGTHTIAAGNVNVVPSGIATLEAFGTHALFDTKLISPAGIATAYASGTAVIVPGNTNLVLTGIATAEAFGTLVIVPGGISVVPTGIATGYVSGSHSLAQFNAISPTGLVSLEAFGTAALHRFLLPTGIASAYASGTALVNRNLIATAIAAAEAFGTAVIVPGTAFILPSGIATAYASGAVVIPPPSLLILPSGITSALVFSDPTILLGVGLSSLPFQELQDSSLFSFIKDDKTFRLDIEGGYEITRATFTNSGARKYRSGFTYISDEVKAALDAHYNAVRGGATKFTWANPTTGQVYVVKFVKPLEFVYRGIGGINKWDVAFEVKEVK